MTCGDFYSNSGNVFECTISILTLVSFGNFIGEYQVLFPVYIHMEQDCIYCMPVCYNSLLYYVVANHYLSHPFGPIVFSGYTLTES